MTRPPTPRRLLAHIFPILLAGCLLGVFSQTGCHVILAWAMGNDGKPADTGGAAPAEPSQSTPEGEPNQSLLPTPPTPNPPRVPPTPPTPPPHSCCSGTWCYCGDGKSACCCNCGARC